MVLFMASHTHDLSNVTVPFMDVQLPLRVVHVQIYLVNVDQTCLQCTPPLPPRPVIDIARRDSPPFALKLRSVCCVPLWQLSFSFTTLLGRPPRKNLCVHGGGFGGLLI